MKDVISEIANIAVNSVSTFGNSQYEVVTPPEDKSTVNSSVFSYQNIWFPGESNERYIYDFSSGILKIEEPGFPLVVTDSDSVGSVITHENGKSLYIIGKNLVDQNYKAVLGSDGLFDSAEMTIANCAFSPDMLDNTSTVLYFIDAAGLEYIHISQNTTTGFFVDSNETIVLDDQPLINSPLSIVGDQLKNNVYLFYITKSPDGLELIILTCNKNLCRVIGRKNIPNARKNITIDVFENKISLLYQGEFVITGVISYKEDNIDVNFSYINIIDSPWLISCAFSPDQRYVFYTTYKDGNNFINYMDVVSGAVVSQNTLGCYKSLKLGPDGNVYGLSQEVDITQQATYLIITPIETPDSFSILEVYTPVSGGFYPNTEYRNLTPVS